jgi:pilus assembly protein Flp/PilA
MKLFRKMMKNEKGATAIEYGLIAALIAVAAISGMSALGTQINTTFGGVATNLSTNTPS